MKSLNRNAMIAVSIIVALLLIAGTFWIGRSALEELAGRREQVLDSALNDYIGDLDIAVGLLTGEDLSSIENLQAYQLRMKQLYGLEKFAFVNEEGLIYTSRGTRTDIDRYAFDYKTLANPEISIKSVNNNIKVVIAMPTDRLPFDGHYLVVCFMEIDMDYMLKNISFQSGSNNTTFCNIYTAEGYSLTNMVLGGLAGENNLITAMERAEFEDGYNIEKLREDFSKGQRGVTSFTYNNIRETMYYVPVHRTDWMLTYLIRESVISEQIDTISEGILKRSLIMSIFAAIILTVIFDFRNVTAGIGRANIFARRTFRARKKTCSTR